MAGSEPIQREAVVPEEAGGERLDVVAAGLFAEFSRSRLQEWIRAGTLQVDGGSARPKDRVSAGAVLRIETVLEERVDWSPEKGTLAVVHEDDEILVIDKPAGVVVHPAAGHAAGTLVNTLLYHAPVLQEIPRAGIVHRLDRDTSGLLVVAKTLRAHGNLVRQLQERSVSREYFALCTGVLTGGGRIDEPIGRHPRQRKKMAVVPSGGKPAVTHFRVVRRFGHFTELAVNLETGRTHQIRVHLAWRRNPLVGDPVYGGRQRLPRGGSTALVQGLREFSRQALHARRLGLTHPATGQLLRFESPLPEDLLDLLDLLESEDAPGDIRLPEA